MTECIFCDIVAGDAPASFVHRGIHVSATSRREPICPKESNAWL
jgi:diadenosine tetraphosphate (Ap4A) HIT family hydrolase